MHRKFILFLVFVIILAAALPVFAVKYGQPDNGEHPYVGILVFFEGGDPAWRCTGTLLSPTLVLTAGHCSDSADGRQAMFWLQETQAELRAAGYPFSGGYAGTGYSYPGWTGALTLPDTHDAGVVVLDTPVAYSGSFPSLAGAGHLDSLATQRGRQNVEFTVVGYGLQAVRPTELRVVDRLKATVSLVNLTSQLTDGYNLHTSNNPGQGHGGSGGTCFGDSGGAIFHNGLIVAVNSFVLNENCAGASFGYRTDRQPVIDWVLSNLGAGPSSALDHD